MSFYEHSQNEKFKFIFSWKNSFPPVPQKKSKLPYPSELWQLCSPTFLKKNPCSPHAPIPINPLKCV